MNIEQERAEFEAWWASRQPATSIKEDAFAAHQAGRAALQSQDREDMDQWLDQLRILITEFGIACADSGAVEMHMMPKIFDHARRAERDSNG